MILCLVAVLVVGLGHRHGIDALEPAVEIDIGAALGAERPEAGHARLAADRTGNDGRRGGIGTTKQNGSPFLKLTMPGRVKRQFIVKGNGSQYVSTTPISGWMPSLMRLGGPLTNKSQPGSVRKSQPV